MKNSRLLAALAALTASITPAFAQETQYLYGYGTGGAALVSPAGTAVLTGSAGQGVLTVSRFLGYTDSAATTITASINNAYRLGSAGDTTVTFPDATRYQGQEIYLYNESSSGNNYTVTPATVLGQTIAGTTPAALTYGTSASYISDGTNWQIL